MSGLLLKLVLTVVLCGFIHEAGHYLTARFYGEKITFSFSWGARLFGVMPVPRYVWRFPARLTIMQRSHVASAGFATETAMAVLFVLLSMPWATSYTLVALLHLFLYPYYAAGSENDFDHIIYVPL